MARRMRLGSIGGSRAERARQMRGFASRRASAGAFLSAGAVSSDFSCGAGGFGSDCGARRVRSPRTDVLRTLGAARAEHARARNQDALLRPERGIELGGWHPVPPSLSSRASVEETTVCIATPYPPEEAARMAIADPREERHASPT